MQVLNGSECLDERRIIFHYLLLGFSWHLWVTVSTVFPCCSSFIMVGRIQHLFITFYDILLCSTEPTSGAVSPVPLQDLDFHCVVESWRQFLQHFNAGVIECAECKCNYSCGESSTQIVWLFRGIIIQIAFTEIATLYTNQSKCFLNCFSWSSWLFSLRCYKI